jgi:NADH dehydrogenase
MKYQKIALIGGSGFVGRHLTHHLHGLGHQCRVLTRHAHRHAELRLSAEVVEVNPYDLHALTNALRGCDAAINLSGILNPASRRHGFREVHVGLTETLVEACHKAGIHRLLHMSALQADQATGSSQYLRSKGEGENRAHTLGQPDIAVTSFRPSVIFGPDDSFLNRFATLLKIPGPMPLACAGARFAPVAVQDVAEAFARALEDRNTFGQRYELCGPDEFTLEQIIRLVAFHTRRYKEIIRLPDWLARMQAHVLQYLPGKPFTPDNYLSLRTASVCSHNGLAELGVKPTPLHAMAPRILGDRSKAAGLNRLRRDAGR